MGIGRVVVVVAGGAGGGWAAEGLESDGWHGSGGEKKNQPIQPIWKRVAVERWRNWRWGGRIQQRIVWHGAVGGRHGGGCGAEGGVTVTRWVGMK